jgi:hypothetical protein
MLRRPRVLAAALPPKSRPGGSRLVAAAAATLLTGTLAVGTVVAAAPSAQAAARTVDGGRLDWGIKESFLTYVTGPIAQGGWTLLDGAASGFRFHSATGSYDPQTGALTAAFGGGVRFTGHEQNGTHRLDMTLRAFTVRIADGRGTLHADVAGKDRETGKMSTSRQAALATLDLGGLDMRGGGSPVALDGVPATLTAEGERAFAGYYPAGTRLDPVSLSVDVRAPAAGSDGEPEPSEKPKDGGGGGRDEDRGKAATGEILDGAVDWGVRRTFRDYVTGPISHGRIDVSDGATEQSDGFRFPDGQGEFDADGPSLDASFGGTVRFRAHEEGGTYALDLKFGDLKVQADGDGAALVADVSAKDRESGEVTESDDIAVADLEVDPAELTPTNDVVELTDIPAALTRDGAAAFGGFYEPGAALDPVSLAVTFDEDAELPGTDDPTAGGTQSTGGSGSATGTPASVGGATDSLAATGNGTPATPLITAAAAMTTAGAAALYTVRRRRPTTD